ncbi:MAG: ABC transporter permease [Anaerolineae bacterium]|nr:ABC transporter permease [Thermoflexales bacterium]MDW8395789.1 ABC transporter permease [Anaerolineae bacterium]
MSTPAAPTLPPLPRPRRWVVQQESVLVAAILALTLCVSLVNPDFLNTSNLLDIAVNTAYIAVAAAGMTMVIVSGNIDISVGSMLGVCATIAGELARNDVPVPLAFAAAVIAGGIMGAVNGALVAYARIPAIVVTLGMLSILRGGLILVTQGRWIESLPQAFFFSQRSTLGIPNPVWVMVIVALLVWFFMRYHRLGRAIYAVGGNAEAARLAGINPRQVHFFVFVVNGLLVGLAAVLYASKFTAIQSNAGQGFELAVISGTVVGGVSILGGTGTVLGAVLGSLLISQIGTAAVFLKVSPFWLQAVQGGLILLTVLVDVLRRRRMT